MARRERDGGATESRTPDVDLARINCSPLPAPRWCPAPDLNWPPAFFKRVQSPDLLTGLKRQNNTPRTSVIETDSPEWHSGARPSSSVRTVVGNPGIEPGRHKGAGFTGPLSPQT